MWFINRLPLLGLSLILTVSLLAQEQTSWSEVLRGKVDKAISGTFAQENLQLKKLVISEALTVKEALAAKEHLYEVFQGQDLKGYAYIGQAPSMKNVFDYIVIFNTDKEIIKSKVLIYREQHGRQIGSTRWLNQFTGMNAEDRPVLGKNIDGISGATISATSMTRAVKTALSTISYLLANELL
jgi:Na+-translocating ferredoxin:NAD+ oxidoreductase RnfG subunit